MIQPVSSEEELTVQLHDATWLVHFGKASEGIVDIKAFPEAEGAPSEPNIYWDIAARHFDEIPKGLPKRVQTAIYQRMRTFC